MTRFPAPIWPVPVTSVSPVASASVVWRREGRLMLTVIVKAQIRLVPGGTAELAEPTAIVISELDGADDVVFVRDDAPALLRADVTAWGKSTSATPSDVALVVGLGDERLLVKQTRASGPTISCFAPILMTDRLGPPISARPRTPGDIVQISDDFDWSELQSAPADQQLDTLRGDEWIATRGLHPEHYELATRLPAQYAMARLYGGEALPQVPLPLRLDSVHLLIHELTGSLIWRAHWPLLADAIPDDLQVAAGIAPFGQILELGDLPPADIIEEPTDEDPWAEMRATRAVTDADLASMASALPSFMAGDANQPGGATYDALEAFRQTRSLARNEQASLEQAFAAAAPFVLAKHAPAPAASEPRASIPGAPWSDEGTPPPAAPSFADVTETVSEVRPAAQSDLAAGARQASPHEAPHHQPRPRSGTSHWFPAVDSQAAQQHALPTPKRPPPPRRASRPRAATPVPGAEAARMAEAQRLAAEQEAAQAKARAEMEERQRRIEEANAERQAREQAAREAEERRAAEAKRFEEEQRLARKREEERIQQEREAKRQKAKQLRSSLYSGMKRRS